MRYDYDAGGRLALVNDGARRVRYLYDGTLLTNIRTDDGRSLLPSNTSAEQSLNWISPVGAPSGSRLCSIKRTIRRRAGSRSSMNAAT